MKETINTTNTNIDLQDVIINYKDSLTQDNRINDKLILVYYLVNKDYNSVSLHDELYYDMLANGELSFLEENVNTTLINAEYINSDNTLIDTNEGTELDYVVDEYRLLWHYKTTGIKGKQGNRNVIKQKIVRFKEEHNVSFDDILHLARYYVNNYKSISNFLQQADYFLYKEKLIDGKKITESRAASLLDEYKDFDISEDGGLMI